MPTVALHSHYWQTTSPPVEPPIGGSGSGGFTPWQITTIGKSGFGLTVTAWLMTLVRHTTS